MALFDYLVYQQKSFYSTKEAQSLSLGDEWKEITIRNSSKTYHIDGKNYKVLSKSEKYWPLFSWQRILAIFFALGAYLFYNDSKTAQKLFSGRQVLRIIEEESGTITAVGNAALEVPAPIAPDMPECDRVRIIDLPSVLQLFEFPQTRVAVAQAVDALVNKEIWAWAVQIERGVPLNEPENRFLSASVIKLIDDNLGCWLLKKHQSKTRFVDYGELTTQVTPHENLLRVVMARKMAEIAQEHNLDRIFIPEKYIHRINDLKLKKFDNKPRSSAAQIDQNAYLVIVREVPNLLDLNIENLNKLNITEGEQRLLANQFCTMLEKSGLSDFSLRNIKIYNHNGVNKLAFIDTEPFGAIVAKGFEKYLIDLKMCICVGYCAAIDKLSTDDNDRPNLPIFNEVFNQRFKEFTEQLGPQ